VSGQSIRRIPWFVAFSVSCLALPARAQFNGGSGAVAPPPAAMGAYGGSGGYGYGPTTWRQTPYQGYLNGAANVTTANADYQLTIQQAKQEREKARRSALQTRRETIQERQWELAQQPSAEDLRQKGMMYDLQRARNNPPLAEIWAGDALNDLLRAIKDGQSHGLTGPEVPLTYEVLQHINLTTGTTYGGVGLLRDGGKLTWPAALRKPEFDMERKKLEEETQKAVKQAYGGPVDVGLVDTLSGTLKELQDHVDAQANDLSTTQFIQASRYLRELKSSYQVLQQSDVTKYFKPNWTPQGATVADLIKQMTQQGLRFAPATSQDEPYYTSLHRSLVDYDIGLQQMAGGVTRR
jgi:hypothetical protein